MNSQMAEERNLGDSYKE